MTLLIKEWIYALQKELGLHKGKVAIGFAVVTLLVLVLGFAWPKTYKAEALVYADDQNIIQPLLEGQASVTRPEGTNQLEIVRERLLSPAVLGQVLLESKQLATLDDRYTVDPKIGALRDKIEIEDAGRNHYRISYASREQQQALDMATAVVSAFVKDSAQSKRQESREAFLFIDSQVKTYKSQLQEAEERLKNFRTDNPGGSDTSTANRLSQLRSSVETLNLELQTAVTRRNGLRQQLSEESRSIGRQYKSDVYRDALIEAQRKLDTLRLSYQETYPDIVALKQQVEDLKQSMTNADRNPSTDNAQVASANPVYQRLKTDLADAEVLVRTLQMRIDSTQKLMGEERDQSKDNAEYQALLAELTRDYNVTKSIYEDMLERREKARLSMTLDIQGQGVTFKIKEPPVYPNQPVGLRFLHFFAAAPLLGLFAPLGLLVAYILLDPRIRFSERVHSALPEGVPVLAVLPHYSTSFEDKLNRSEWGVVTIVVAVVFVIYIAAGIARVSGVG